MSIAVTFDTLQYVKRLKAAKVPEEQAEAQAEALRELWGTQEVATRADVRELEAATDSRFELLRKDIDLLRKDVELVDQRSQSRFRLLYWMLGALVASMLAVAAALAPAALRVYFGG